jgi:hypothetical protein
MRVVVVMIPEVGLWRAVMVVSGVMAKGAGAGTDSGAWDQAADARTAESPARARWNGSKRFILHRLKERSSFLQGKGMQRRLGLFRAN